jgi:hypothetical protein
MANGDDGFDASTSSWNNPPYMSGGNIVPTDWTTPSTAIGDGAVGGGMALGTPAATPAPASGGGGVLGDIGSWVTQNPGNALTVLAGGGMLASEAFGTNPEQANMNLLQQSATSAGSMATALQAPLFSGVLPPGAQAALNQSKQNQIANIRSSYAKMGMSGSTGEADAINTANQASAAQQFNMAESLFSQAAGYAKLQSQDYLALLEEQRAQDQDFSNALSRFVSALAGGGTSGGGTGTNATQTATQTATSSGPSLLSSIFGSS